MPASSRFHPLLNRDQHEFEAPDLTDERVLVTGSSGSIGLGAVPALEKLGAEVQGFDVAEGLDVTDLETVERMIGQFRPTAIIHLAAHKYATSAESLPYDVANLNVHGTHYLCSAAKRNDVAKLVLASTCKSIVPETVYGASKLVAERIALNAGYTVGRFFNVIETAGNVFELWKRQMDAGEALKVTPCRRYFISWQEAVSFLVHLLGQPPGRYAPFPGPPATVQTMAARFAPDHPIEFRPPRRGDRLIEPLVGEHETFELLDGKLMIVGSSHDMVVSDEALMTPPSEQWAP